MRAGDGSILAALLGVGVVLSPVFDRAAPRATPEAGLGSIARAEAIPTASQAAPAPVSAALPRAAAEPASSPLASRPPAAMPAEVAVAAPPEGAAAAPPEVIEGDGLLRFSAIGDRDFALVARADGSLSRVDGAFELDGRPVVVHVAASWCRPCARELASFEALVGQVPRALLVMAEDVGGPAGLAAAAELLADRAEPSSRAWPAGLELRADPAWAWAHWLGRDALPLTAVIDHRGAVTFLASGPLDADAAARVASLARAEGP